MNKTITTMTLELIDEIQRTRGEYDPTMLAEQLIDLSRLYCGLTSKIADFEFEYSKLLKEQLEKDLDMPYNKVEAITKNSEIYYQLKKAQALEKSVIQIIRASNKFIKIKENEISTIKYT